MVDGLTIELTEEVLNILIAAERIAAPHEKLKAKAVSALAQALLSAKRRESNVLQIIRETLDSPTIVNAKINCKNLTNTMQRIERAYQSE